MLTAVKQKKKQKMEQKNALILVQSKKWHDWQAYKLNSEELKRARSHES